MLQSRKSGHNQIDITLVRGIRNSDVSDEVRSVVVKWWRDASA